MQGKAKMNRYITIEKFIDILNEENLPRSIMLWCWLFLRISLCIQTGS
jgi:hypothetical protein